MSASISSHRRAIWIGLAAALSTGLAAVVCAAPAQPPYKNPLLPIDKRVEDLLKRMTLDEKLAQLRSDGNEAVFGPQLKTTGYGQVTPGILRGLDSRRSAETANRIQRDAKQSRLGIPIVFHDEALHGLIGNGCTSFPQAIGMAATWDPALIKKAAATIATEARSRGNRQVLSPVINVIRDARWGRVEESYGEDPLLTSAIGVAFVQGFEQAGVVTTPKHYIVNAWDGGRDSHSVQISERSLREIYLPPFKAVFQQGGARSVMSSYNSVNGRPATASRWLLTDILRKELGFQGYVVSDYGSLGGVMYAHRTAATKPETAAATLWAGLDMEYPSEDFYGAPLKEAVKKGLVKMGVVDEAVRRVLRVKFQLGLFEDPFVDPNLAERTVQSAAHRQASLDVARKSLVLLRNRDNALPLSKGLKRVAVLGPTANSAPLGGYSGWGQKTTSVFEGIRAKLPNAQVLYAKGASFGGGSALPAIPAEALSHDGKAGLKAEYFANEQWKGNPTLVRVDRNVDFNWVDAAPDSTIPADHFSVRWTGKLTPPKTGAYRLSVTSDDGFRLFVDGRMVSQFIGERGADTNTCTVNLTEGKPADIRLDYYEVAGQASVSLGWSYAGSSANDVQEAVALAQTCDAAVIVASIVEGEGRDRAFLDLPGNQEELINAVSATGVPTVVVLQAGAPVTMSKWIDNVGAVLDAWYPGQEGGTAVADALFGDVNPGGKLPITFPLSVGQCPTYYNLEPSGRGYDYVDLSGRPLFPFGHGLSYTTFEYSNLKVTPERGKRDTVFTVAFDVTNSGKVAGDEVVQLYTHDLVASIVRPLKELKGFRRVTLAPGETKQVSFKLGPEDLSFLNERMKPVVEPGDFDVMVGSSSDDIRLKGVLKVGK